MQSRALLVCLLVVSARASVAAADHYGRVTFGAVPVPGAAVTATRGRCSRSGNPIRSLRERERPLDIHPK